MDEERNALPRIQLISLLTDFGIKDAYVSTMKGVILRICPTATIVDISHDVAKYDVLEGSFKLLQASPYFPEGTIHLAVVDPDVGTVRRRIIIQGRHCIYVGPDNGILSLAAKNDGVVKVLEIKNESFMLPNFSRTFEGRDIFAPTAAHLANGVEIDEFGPQIDNFLNLSIAKPENKGGVLLGETIYIDDFGNITTNISEEMLREIAIGASIEVTVGNTSKRCLFRKTYGEVPVGSPLLTLGSIGFLEVAVNQGSAKFLFKAKVGDKVSLLPL